MMLFPCFAVYPAGNVRRDAPSFFTQGSSQVDNGLRDADNQVQFGNERRRVIVIIRLRGEFEFMYWKPIRRMVLVVKRYPLHLRE